MTPAQRPLRLDYLSSLDAINGCTVIQPASIEGSEALRGMIVVSPANVEHEFVEIEAG